MGPFIFPSDVKRISNFLCLSPLDFILQKCVENKIMINDKKIKVFTLKIKNGNCCFLNNNNLCEIFECRPYQCINAPYNFMAKYSYWSHMPCVTEDDFITLDSSKNDKIIFSELLDDGYKNII